MAEAHTQRAHARLAPSAAHRWMHCPGSVRLSEGMPNTTSVFAAEGTAAHELCAECLQTGADASLYLGQYVDVASGKIVDTPEDTDDEHRFFEITDEMADAVQMYADHVRGLFAPLSVLDVEQRLDMTHLHPDISGTGDATVYDPERQHLDVCDFKYGKGVAVDADDNPQLLLYAAGAARRLGNRGVASLTVHIIQPRAPHPKGPIRSFDLDLIDLLDFEATLSAAAALTDKPDAPVAAGEWCRFCPAQPVCPTARADVLRAAVADFDPVDIDGIAGIELPAPAAMSPEHRADILRFADRLATWTKSVQEFEHAQAMAGNGPAGFKLVAKRATRKWIDEGAAKAKLLELAIEPFEEPKLKSPAKVESQFPGKNKAERQKAMADLVEARSSGTNLVLVDDPRPAVVCDAKSEFGDAYT